MAKTAVTKSEAREKRAQVMPETLDFSRHGEKEIGFWDFTKNPELFCTNPEETDLEYACYKVTECKTQQEYYVPAHKKLKDLFENNDKTDIFKIVHVETRSFDKGRKTYNVYEVFVAK